MLTQQRAACRAQLFAWARPRQQHLSPQRRGLARPVRWDRVEEPSACHLRISWWLPPQRRCTTRKRRRLVRLVEKPQATSTARRSLSFPPRSGHIDWESVAQEYAVTTSSSPTGTEEAYSPPAVRGGAAAIEMRNPPNPYDINLESHAMSNARTGDVH